MSAHMVNAATIDAMVAGAKAQGPAPFTWYTDDATQQFGVRRHAFTTFASDDEPDTYNPDTLGRMLWAENLASVNYRYPDTLDEPDHLPGPIGVGVADIIAYTYGPGPRVIDLDPLGLIGVISGYRYQSCEHPDWKSSIALAFTRRLEAAVIRDLIEQTGARPWTIDDLAEIEGETSAEPTPGGGWTIRHTPRRGAAVSITDMIAGAQRRPHR